MGASLTSGSICVDILDDVKDIDHEYRKSLYWSTYIILKSIKVTGA